MPATAVPSASNCIVIDVGLIASWLPLSFHTFVTDASVTSGTCLLVIVVTVPTVVLLIIAYPVGNALSLHVYTIGVVEWLYLGNPSILSVNLLSFNVTVLPSTAVPSASNCIVIDVGRIPSWFCPSSHTFVTVASVTSGTCLLVIVKPSADTVLVYPAGTTTSLNVYLISVPSAVYLSNPVNV